MFIKPVSGAKKGTIAVYNTLTEDLVIKKMDLTNLKNQETYLVSSNTQLFHPIYDKVNSFTFFEIDLNFVNGTELDFSDFGTLSETTLSTSTSSMTFTSQSFTSGTTIAPAGTDNKADALIASYGTPAFKTFPEDTLTLGYETTTFPYYYDLVGPCTDPDSSYDYVIDNLPGWLEFASDSTTSTQTINITSSVPFGSTNIVEYSNVLKATKDSTTLERPFTILIYKCQ